MSRHGAEAIDTACRLIGRCETTEIAALQPARAGAQRRGLARHQHGTSASACQTTADDNRRPADLCRLAAVAARRLSPREQHMHGCVSLLQTWLERMAWSLSSGCMPSLAIIQSIQRVNCSSAAAAACQLLCGVSKVARLCSAPPWLTWCCVGKAHRISEAAN